MKKLLSIIIACIFLFSLTACNGGKNPNGNGSDDQVKELTLSAKNLSIGLFGQAEITAKFKDQGKTAEWENINPQIIEMTVEGNKAVVFAKGSGSAVITATSGTLKETCAIEVAESSEALYLTSDWADLDVALGGKINYNAKVSFGGEVFDKAKISYEIADESLATITEDGVVTALKAGTTTLTAVAEYLGHQSNVLVSTITVKTDPIIKVNMSNVDIFVPSEHADFASESKSLSLVMQDGDEETEITDYTFESADESIAKFENGKVVAVALGETKITIKCTYKDKEYTSVISVKVQGLPDVKVNITEEYFFLYDRALMSTYATECKVPVLAMADGKKLSDDKVSFAITQGEGVVSIEDGVVTALTSGVAKVQASVSYNGITVTDECTVFVEKAVDGLYDYDASVLYAASVSGYKYDINATPNLSAENAKAKVYEYSYERDRALDKRKLILSEDKLGDNFVAGNYLVFEVYLVSYDEGGKGLRISSDGTWSTDANTKWYDLEGNQIPTNNNCMSVKGQWVRAVMPISEYLTASKPRYLYIDRGNVNAVVYFSKVSVCTAEAHATLFGA